MLRVTVLGCGTSSGVPVPGCDCTVCTSGDPRNARTRSGVWLRLAPEANEVEDGGSVLIDTPTDLRTQALREGVRRVDAVLYTHAHADHVFGFDELRTFGFRRRAPIPCYGPADVLDAIATTFAYAFTPPQQRGGGTPQVVLRPIDDATTLTLFGHEIMPIPAWHGKLPVFGYRIGPFAYMTDCNRIDPPSLARLAGVEVLILDALRYDPHPTHYSVAQAIEVAQRIGPRRTYLTHLNHDIDYRRPAVALPNDVEFSYDGLQLDFP
ncbi:MAG: MBL fold metallo-hydrolase [Acidobacteriota bacterium]